MSNPTVEEAVGRNRAAGLADGEELASRFKGGDESAFDGLVRFYQSRIFNLAYRMVNNHADAGDLTQEVFVKVFRSIGKFRGESSFTTWLYALATNTCRNRRRSMQRLAFFEIRSLDEPADGNGHGPDCATAADPDPAEAMRKDEVMKLVEQSVAALPADFAAVVIMKDIQGMAYEEIAGALHCSLGTVKSRLSRGRLLVRDRLKKMGGEEWLLGADGKHELR